jgi:DNA-binding MarR family transcriptional regulator
MNGLHAPLPSRSASKAAPSLSLLMTSSARDFYLIRQLNQAVRRRIEACLAADQLTATQYLVLSMLDRREPQSSAELARLSNVSAQAMGGFIKTLEEQGLIEREEDPNNRRIILVQRTRAGKALLDRVEKQVDGAEEDFFSVLSDAKRTAFRKLLLELRAGDKQLDSRS